MKETNQKDVNGKIIKVGDILEADSYYFDESYYGVVYYDDEGFYVEAVVRADKKDSVRGISQGVPHELDERPWRIVGNIKTHKNLINL